jgi:hydrogenase maturation protease
VAAEQHGAGWQEAAECEIEIPDCRFVELSGSPLRQTFSLPEECMTENGVTRRRQHIEGAIEARAESIDQGAWRISVRIENLVPRMCDESNCGNVLLQSFVSTHTILRLLNGSFLSLIDPPEGFREAAALCKNTGTWPVLAGDDGRQDTMLSSPIILYDNPQIAPESPGDLFDGTEIDEILTLRILMMTDEEKSEVRRTDERARKILDRTEALPPEEFMKLHGVLRSAVSRGADT